MEQKKIDRKKYYWKQNNYPDEKAEAKHKK